MELVRRTDLCTEGEPVAARLIEADNRVGAAREGVAHASACKALAPCITRDWIEQFFISAVGRADTHRDHGNRFRESQDISNL